LHWSPVSARRRSRRNFRRAAWREPELPGLIEERLESLRPRRTRAQRAHGVVGEAAHAARADSCSSVMANEIMGSS
jgi:hypothetical protein